MERNKPIRGCYIKDLHAMLRSLDFIVKVYELKTRVPQEFQIKNPFAFFSFASNHLVTRYSVFCGSNTRN